MTEIKGVLTTLNHALPDGLDAARLAQWRLKDGSDYLTFRNQIAAAFDGLNAELLSVWGDLCYVTFEDHFEYPNGGAVTDFPDVSELDEPDPDKGSTVGHTIDLRTKAKKIGGSKKFFRDTRQAVINATISDFVKRGRQTFEKGILTRAMTDNENLLGTSGYDVGFAAASASVSYAPPAWGGKAFTNSHTHYIGVASASKTRADLLEELAETLHEHGHDGPYNAYVAAADVRNYRALKGFRQPLTDRVLMVDMGGRTDQPVQFERGAVGGAPVGGGYYIGSYDTGFGEMLLKATARIPTAYGLAYKSYGINNEKNPIAIRVHPDTGFGFRLIEEPSFDSMYPIKSVTVEIEYGLSCGNDRTVGAAGFLVSGGVWVDPVIA